MDTKQIRDLSLNAISMHTGVKPTSCSCDQCKRMCRTLCLGTPHDMIALIEAGYGDRLVPVTWVTGLLFGLTNKPVEMVQPRLEKNGWCTFYKNGLCELHDKGLKPTEGILSGHTKGITPETSMMWYVAQTWLPFQDAILDMIK